MRDARSLSDADANKEIFDADANVGIFATGTAYIVLRTQPSASTASGIAVKIGNTSASEQESRGIRQYQSHLRIMPQFLSAQSKIDSLLGSKPQWAGREVEPPSRHAAKVAKRIYFDLIIARMTPDRVIASGAGGIAFCFLRGDAYADMECLNSEELIASTVNRASGERKIWEFSLKTLPEIINRIRRFLAAHEQSAV